jgi:glycosyltransferase involved in cell wall biosynthesis
MNSDLVSVVIPCFKQAHFLDACIASLEAQTHRDWEAIIVNDGSPDNTRDASHALMHRDGRVRYVEKMNGGLSSARNAGLEGARGRWIQFLDADDLIEPTKLATQVAQLASAKRVAFSCCDYWLGAASDPRVRLPRTQASCDFKLPRPVLDMALRWEWSLSIPIHTALFDARFFRELGVGFDQALPNHEDWDMWMQVLRHQPEIFYVPEELAIYRYGESSMSRNPELMWKGFSAAVRKQSGLYAEDEDVLRSLEYMQRLIDYRYHRTLKSRIRRVLDHNRYYKQGCPWPVQKFIARMTDPPVPPFTW